MITVAAACLMGCSVVGVQVPRLMPARKANLGRFKTAAVSDFVGLAPDSAGAAAELADGVRQALSNYKGLTVLDRSRLGEVLSELRLSTTELTDPGKRQQLGKFLTAGVLVAGKITSYSYDEEVTKEQQKCTKYEGEPNNQRKVEYECTHYTRKGKALIRASIDVVDVTTGSTVVSDQLEQAPFAKTEAIDKDPDSIDGKAMLRSAQRAIVDEFSKDVLPFTVNVEVRFRKDGDLPALERGISYAQTGDWANALSTFKEALTSARNNPKIGPKVLAKAFADVGLALACQGDYKEADENLNKAFQTSGDDDYLADRQMVKGWATEQQKLAEQLKEEKAPAPATPEKDKAEPPKGEPAKAEPDAEKPAE
jgi:tetratricopeptide (TPR) repeat protein